MLFSFISTAAELVDLNQESFYGLFLKSWNLLLQLFWNCTENKSFSPKQTCKSNDNLWRRNNLVEDGSSLWVHPRVLFLQWNAVEVQSETPHCTFMLQYLTNIYH